MAAQPKSGGTYDALIKLLLIGDSGETTALKRVGGADSLAEYPVRSDSDSMGACCLAGVGKSCLLLRFSEDSFQTSFITTIG